MVSLLNRSGPRVLEAETLKEEPMFTVEDFHMRPEDILTANEEPDTDKIMDSISVGEPDGVMPHHTTTMPRVSVETVPRTTLLKMIQTTPLDQDFVFKVRPRTGEDYVHNIRTVLSRAKMKAVKSKRQLDEWKLLLRGIKFHEDYDEVTLVRTKARIRKFDSIDDALLDSITLDKE